ncbi:unnamed protein product [Musa textilis]
MRKALNCSLLLFKFFSYTCFSLLQVELLLLALSRKQSEGCTKEGKKVKKNCCRRKGKHLETINKADKVKQLLLKRSWILIKQLYQARCQGSLTRCMEQERRSLLER